MKLFPKMQAEKTYVQKTLGDEVICDRCKTTLANYGSQCSADLSEMCPGFCRIESVRMEFEMKVAKGTI